MSKRIRWALAAVAGIVVTGNFTNVADSTGVTHLLTWMWASRSVLAAPLLSKGTLALSTFVLGLLAGDAVVRQTIRFESDAGWRSATWLRYKRQTILFAMKGIPPWSKTLDLAFELRSLNAALVHPSRGMPALPTVDPTDVAGMVLTKRYLTAVGSLRQSRLAETREIALAVVRHAETGASSVGSQTSSMTARLGDAWRALRRP